MTDKRKRAAPTIDLKATEMPGSKPVAADSVPAPEQQETPAPPPPPPPREGALPPRSEAPPPSPPHDFVKTYATPVAAAFAGALLG
ncbi:MAG TPA: hypothetical protein VGJ01_13910, partial [Pseudolabrys sp.]